MVAIGLRWYVQVTILGTVKTRPCSLFMPFWQDIIVLHPQQGEKHHARCAFPRILSVDISTDILLNIFVTVLLKVRLHRYVWRLLVGNTYFPLVIVCLTHSLMGWRVYWVTVIFNNYQENYVIARNLCSLFWKEFFCKMESEV